MNRSQMMAAVKSKNTKPEMLIRRLVYSMGYRYRLHHSELPGKPDLAFIGRKKAIFVHGCFWHQHDCVRGKKPSTNKEFWFRKLERNKKRDKQNVIALKTAGWGALVIWECELSDEKKLRKSIRRFLEG